MTVAQPIVSALRRLAGRGQPGRPGRPGRARDYISVACFSSVGKKTLIGKLLEGQLCERFDMNGRAQAYGWAFEPLDELFESRADHVLYQWQVKYDRLIDDLVNRFPNASHRAIVIWRPWREHLRDWIADYGDHMTGDPSVANLVAGWDELIVPRFRHDLPKLGVQVQLVNGATPNYDRLDWESIPPP